MFDTKNKEFKKDDLEERAPIDDEDEVEVDDDDEIEVDEYDEDEDEDEYGDEDEYEDEDEDEIDEDEDEIDEDEDEDIEDADWGDEDEDDEDKVDNEQAEAEKAARAAVDAKIENLVRHFDPDYITTKYLTDFVKNTDRRFTGTSIDWDNAELFLQNAINNNIVDRLATLLNKFENDEEKDRTAQIKILNKILCNNPDRLRENIVYDLNKMKDLDVAEKLGKITEKEKLDQFGELYYLSNVVLLMAAGQKIKDALAIEKQALKELYHKMEM